MEGSSGQGSAARHGATRKRSKRRIQGSARRHLTHPKRAELLANARPGEIGGREPANLIVASFGQPGEALAESNAPRGHALRSSIDLEAQTMATK